MPKACTVGHAGTSHVHVRRGCLNAPRRSCGARPALRSDTHNSRNGPTQPTFGRNPQRSYAQHKVSDVAERYCAGLPSIGRRELSVFERRNIHRALRWLVFELALLLVLVAGGVAVGTLANTAIEHELVAQSGRVGLAALLTGFVGAFGYLLLGRHRLKWLAAGGLVYLLAVAGLAAVAPQLRLPHPILTWGIAIVTAALGLVFVGSRYLRCARLLLRWRRIAQDLTHGEVERFEGTIQRTAIDRALTRLVAPESFEPNADHHRFDALPRSGLLVCINGRRVAQLHLAYLTHVAPSAPHAFRTALPSGLAPVNPGSVSLQRRSLTAAERTELDRHIEQLRGRISTPLLATAAALATVVWRLHVSESSTAGMLDWICVAGYALCAVAYVAYFRRVRAANKLECDRDLRWVVTVQDQPGASTAEIRPPKLEVLPISQLAWTENATPASWRVAPF